MSTVECAEEVEMLTEEIKSEIEVEMHHYPRKQAVCIEALKVIQRHRGWVSDESIRELAEFLEMTPDELDSVATFYDKIFRRPVGKHVIFVCDSVSCWIMGYDRVRERLTQLLGTKLGETSADGRFTLLPNVCLGACDHAPALMIGRDLHRDVEPDNVEAILDRYKGQER
jgi:NADH-quinone oxidoreductase subunit E